MEQEIATADLSEFSYFKLRVLWMNLQKFIMDLFTRKKSYSVAVLCFWYF